MPCNLNPATIIFVGLHLRAQDKKTVCDCALVAGKDDHFFFNDFVGLLLESKIK